MEKYVRVADGVRATIDDDGGFVLDVKSGICFGLNPVGAIVWRQLSAARQMSELISHVSERFAQTPRSVIEEDVRSFVTDLVVRGLVAHSTDRSLSGNPP